MRTDEIHRRMTRMAGRRAARRFALGLAALIATVAVNAQRAAEPAERAQPAPAEVPQRELLNSERIEQRFGSYGIDVLQSDGRYRVSNLHSLHDGEKICRTFAVVAYPQQIDPRFAAEHEEIVGGGSIGAVFARNGWTVTKRHLHFGELPATPKVAALMDVGEGEPLAAHVYVLTVVKEGLSLRYATIAEIHHPDYLSVADLPRIYGRPAAADEQDPIVPAILDEAAARMR